MQSTSGACTTHFLVFGSSLLRDIQEILFLLSAAALVLHAASVVMSVNISKYEWNVTQVPPSASQAASVIDLP